ncbi:[LSU ribosomal protein L11P]-lysine N-methyltransferase [Hasllibacter halocynthiae]|uniref:Ribosomal protein L11 methyltransferase n=1 Tax=Hasllibacter halocynthiae TaxID=595589 RepID=A0A2T0X9P3_9RHOB|nr:50S ribosomal protein L11 methyltransferase [Hasllibacter halocynthiae]PRY95649.1 [LSU ribosomal protein L11P]-lysine N-methyltransferase [Hasllibacter halocynthiae]
MTRATTPATWTAFATLRGEGAARRLETALEGMDPAPEGIGVFEVEDDSGLWEVGGYFTEAPDPVALALAEAAFGVSFAVSELPETDWVAHVRRELAPVEAGRFFVHGAHDAAKVPAGSVPLLIEAAMAFGTGHHGTTLGCLLLLDEILSERVPARVLDLGCGTAVLAMAARKAAPGAVVVATDVDPVAIEVAEANLAANGLAGAVETVLADGTGHPRIAASAPYDLVMANILMGPLLGMADGVAPLAEGDLILSGLLRDQADPVADRYGVLGFAEVGRREAGDWAALRLRRD